MFTRKQIATAAAVAAAWYYVALPVIELLTYVS